LTNPKPTASPGGTPPDIPIGNFLSLVAGEVGARSIAFFAAAVLARRLGAEAFGILGLATALTSYLILAVSTGLQDLAAREVARHPREAARIAAGVIRVRLCLGLAGCALLVAVAALLPKPAIVRAAVAVSALSLLPLALDTSWVYKALGRTRRVGAGLVLSQAVFVTGVLLLIRGPSDLLRVPVLQALGELTAALVLVPVVRGAWRSGSLRDGAATLRGAGTVTVNRLLRTIIVTSDVVLLSFLADDRQVGLYSAAYRICFLLTAIAVAAHVVFLPSLARFQANTAAAAVVLGRSVWLSWAVALPFVLGGVLISPDLLSLLFGSEYRAGGNALRLLLAAIGLLFLHGTMHNVFLVRNQLRLEMIILGSAAAVNLGLNFVFIPLYGVSGAALSTLIAEGMILVAEACVVVRWGIRPPLRPLCRPLIAAICMGAIMVLLPNTVPVEARIAIGGLSYVTALALTGGLPQEATRHFGSRASGQEPDGSSPPFV
jgi:O-antigen/teichoic acid export membrane protein